MDNIAMVASRFRQIKLEWCRNQQAMKYKSNSLIYNHHQRMWHARGYQKGMWSTELTSESSELERKVINYNNETWIQWRWKYRLRIRTDSNIWTVIVRDDRILKYIAKTITDKYELMMVKIDKISSHLKD